MNILLIGSGAREHAIAKAIRRSEQSVKLVCLSTIENPALKMLCDGYVIAALDDQAAIATAIHDYSINYAVIGPEAPLAAGMADYLRSLGVAAFGPTMALAQVESSKAYARHLLQHEESASLPAYQAFDSLDGIEGFIARCNHHYVIKANGLMSGKGVKVSGEHLHTTEEALAFAKEIFAKGQTLVIEEKLEGVEFSLFSVSDGKTVKHFPLVQDHKRAYEGDTGPNTGGMGSYSCANGLLPFLSEKDVAQAQRLNEKTLSLLQQKEGEDYQGILYGGYMLTANGVMNIEYNARFGDPEVMNLLTLMDSDFVTMLTAVSDQSLQQYDLRFKPEDSVCVYAVPKGYPQLSEKGCITVPSGEADALFIGGIYLDDAQWALTGSRALAVCAHGESLEKARKQALNILSQIEGPLFYRKDIASNESIKNKCAIVAAIKEKNSAG